MAESGMALDGTMEALIDDIMQHGLGLSWEADGTRHWAAGVYSKLGTKGVTRRGSGSKGWCGKSQRRWGTYVTDRGGSGSRIVYIVGLYNAGKGSNQLGINNA